MTVPREHAIFLASGTKFLCRSFVIGSDMISLFTPAALFKHGCKRSWSDGGYSRLWPSAQWFDMMKISGHTRVLGDRQHIDKAFNRSTLQSHRYLRSVALTRLLMLSLRANRYIFISDLYRTICVSSQVRSLFGHRVIRLSCRNSFAGIKIQKSMRHQVVL